MNTVFERPSWKKMGYILCIVHEFFSVEILLYQEQGLQELQRC